MPNVKKEVTDLLAKLPDDCSLEDIQYHLYVLQKIEHSLENVEKGKVLSQAEVEKRMDRWIRK